jgi:hypothetical protein
VETPESSRTAGKPTSICRVPDWDLGKLNGRPIIGLSFHLTDNGKAHGSVTAADRKRGSFSGVSIRKGEASAQ